MINMSSTQRPQTPPHRRNADARRAFWSVPGRTVQTAIADARREAFMREANAVGIVDLDSDGDDEAEEDAVPSEEEEACHRKEGRWRRPAAMTRKTAATRKAAVATAAP